MPSSGSTTHTGGASAGGRVASIGLPTAVLLAEEQVVGKPAEEVILHDLLRGVVGVGDEVGAGLLADENLFRQRSSSAAPRRAASVAASR